MLRALGEYEVGGLTTLIPFHKAILATEQWAKGETCRDLMEDRDWLKSTAPADAEPARPRMERGADRPRLQSRGMRQALRRQGDRRGDAAGAAPAARPQRPRSASEGRWRGAGARASLPSPLQGTVLKVAVEQGAEVSEGDLICVIEAMKMENEIIAHRAGKVTSSSRGRRRRLQRRRARGNQVEAPASTSLAVFSPLLFPAFLLRLPDQLLAFLSRQRDFG